MSRWRHAHGRIGVLGLKRALFVAAAARRCSPRLQRDGGDRRRVTHVRDAPCGFSPGGRRLLFLRLNPADDNSDDLMVTNVDGSGKAMLIRRVVGLSCDWSPDGNHFLAEADNRLMLLDPRGAVTPIPIKLLVAARGSFSPDGTHIVFSGSEDGGANNIYTARLDGSELVRVTHTPETKSAGTGAAESGTDRAGYPLPAGGATAGQPLRPRAGQPSIRRPEFTARELQRIQIQGRTSTVPS